MEGNLRTIPAAKYLGIGKTTLQLWAKEGKIHPGVKLSPRVRVWPISVLDDFLKRQEKGQSNS